nr:hypothetical protein GCM10020092_002800 [Actinoplanes digitatis]
MTPVSAALCAHGSTGGPGSGSRRHEPVSRQPSARASPARASSPLRQPSAGEELRQLSVRWSGRASSPLRQPFVAGGLLCQLFVVVLVRQPSVAERLRGAPSPARLGRTRILEGGHAAGVGVTRPVVGFRPAAPARTPAGPGSDVGRATAPALRRAVAQARLAGGRLAAPRRAVVLADEVAAVVDRRRPASLVRRGRRRRRLCPGASGPGRVVSVNCCQLGRLSQDGRRSGSRCRGASAGCQVVVGSVNCCQVGRSSVRGASHGGVVLGGPLCHESAGRCCQDGAASAGRCCQDGVASAGGCCQDGVASAGCQVGVPLEVWSSVCGVGQAVLEMAGSRVGASVCGGRLSASSPCHASVVVRQPCEPDAERHSVVCRQRALSVVARHSEVCVRQPTPSAGRTGWPVAATSDQRLSVPDCSPDEVSGFCAQASARNDQATASGIGCMLPVSAGDPVPQTVAPGLAISDESGSSGRSVGVQDPGALLSRGRRAP